MSAKSTLVALWSIILLPATVAAQALRGVVVDQADAPVPGVVVQLLDSTSATVARTLSDVHGEFRLGVRIAGAYRVRTLRIGFRPMLSEPVGLSAGAVVSRRFVLTGVPVALGAVHVSSRNVCAGFGDSTAAAFVVWEQVRAALTAAQLTAAAHNIFATTIAYERALDPDGQRVRRQSSSSNSEYVTQPWRTVPADSLRRIGYVVIDRDNATTYYAPGLDMLLSPVFVEDHCFRVTADGDRLGLVFEPTQDRRDVAEIRGTIWLDRATASLQSLEFRYANVSAAQQSEAGGDMRFARMSDGTWAIVAWSIRMPVVETRMRSVAMGGEETRVTEIRVTGGELSLARRGADTLWSRPTPVLERRLAQYAVFTGVVLVDSSAQPIAGAQVTLTDLSRTALTNERGAFRLADLPAGTHRLLVRRFGYGPLDASLTFAAGQTDERKVYLSRVTLLDSVVVTERMSDRALGDFDENRRLGLGHFFTREELAKREGRSTAAVLAEIPGLRIVSGKGSHAWVRSGRSPMSLSRGAVRPSTEDRAKGAPAASCYAQVYLDNMLIFSGRTTAGGELEPLFDVNSIAVDQIEAIEYFASPAQTPAKYSGLNSTCGVLVIHTRR